MKMGARVGSIVVLAGLVGAACMSMRGAETHRDTSGGFDGAIGENARRLMDEGRAAFRHDTFGSEGFWGGALQLHQGIAGQKHGGVGTGVSPKQALAAGLKVDVAALPPSLVEALKAGKVDLDDPGSTLALIKANAVVGVTGFFDAQGRLTSLGIQCALCHSHVDDALAPGIGRRLDGWPNSDLNIGAIVSLAPTLKPYVDLLGVDEATVRKVLASWGPGKFDAQLTLDGKAFRPDGKSAATLIPPAFGLAGVNQHTWTGSWGGVTYWNAFVANLEMHGRGNFFDPRLNNREQYPVAARAGLANTRTPDDRITPKLAALHFYQLAMPVPKPPGGNLRPGARRAWPDDLLREGAMRHLPCAAHLHGAGLESPQGRRDRDRFLPGRPFSGSRVSHDSAPGTLGGPEDPQGRFLPRWALPDAAGRREPLQSGHEPRADGGRIPGPSRVPQVALECPTRIGCLTPHSEIRSVTKGRARGGPSAPSSVAWAVAPLDQ